MAVALQGRFSSYYSDKPSPLLAEEEGAKNEPDGSEETAKQPQIAGVIDKSSDSARLILFGSADFLSDQTLELAANVGGQQDFGALQLVENAIDWSLEDAGLLSIRSRGHYSRTLAPLDRDSQVLCEYLNYALVLGGVLVVFLLARLKGRRTRIRYQLLLEGRG